MGCSAELAPALQTLFQGSRSLADTNPFDPRPGSLEQLQSADGEIHLCREPPQQSAVGLAIARGGGNSDFDALAVKSSHTLLASARLDVDGQNQVRAVPAPECGR